MPSRKAMPTAAGTTRPARASSIRCSERSRRRYARVHILPQQWVSWGEKIAASTAIDGTTRCAVGPPDPPVQALERPEGSVGHGRSMIGLSHDYWRTAPPLVDVWTWRRGRSQASITSAAGGWASIT